METSYPKSPQQAVYQAFSHSTHMRKRNRKTKQKIVQTTSNSNILPGVHLNHSSQVKKEGGERRNGKISSTASLYNQLSEK